MSPKSDYKSKLICSLNDLRKENQLCDVEINVGGKTFAAHRNVLAARSSYFLAMFTSGFKEATESKISIDGKAEVFEALLNFVYTGKLQMSDETAYELLEMACYMQLHEATEFCAKFIKLEYDLSIEAERTITMDDAYKIYELAWSHSNLKSLARGTEKHMCNVIEELKSSEAFLQIASGEFLTKFLECEDLANRYEEKEVLEMVVKWLKCDFENRCSFAPSLIKRVRLGLVPEEILTRLLDEEIVEAASCKEVLEEVVQLKKSEKTYFQLAQQQPHLFTTRSTITAPIAVSKGEGNSTESSPFYFFNMKKKDWYPIHSIPSLTVVPSLIVADGEMYAVGGLEEYEESDYSDGGSDNDGYQPSVISNFRNYLQRYDAERNRWCDGPEMSRARQPLLAHVNKRIYAIGGEDNMGMLEDVEYYDITEGRWHSTASLPEQFECTAAVGYQGNVLVHGEGISSAGDIEEQILVYNPMADEWQCKFNQLVGSYGWNRPFLIIHKDQCYRVAFHGIVEEKPLIKPVTLNLQDGALVSVTLGEDLKQDFIPPNKLGAFRIGEDVFVSAKGSVHHTGLTILDDQDRDIELNKLDKFRRFRNLYEISNVVTFTFDWKD